MHLAQIKAFAQAISKHERHVGLNNMSWQRVAYHADSKEYAKVTKDLQRK